MNFKERFQGKITKVNKFGLKNALLEHNLENHHN